MPCFRITATVAKAPSQLPSEIRMSPTHCKLGTTPEQFWPAKHRRNETHPKRRTSARTWPLLLTSVSVQGCTRLGIHNSSLSDTYLPVSPSNYAHRVKSQTHQAIERLGRKHCMLGVRQESKVWQSTIQSLELKGLGPGLRRPVSVQTCEALRAAGFGDFIWTLATRAMQARLIQVRRLLI